jgi:uncharacterized protein (TIGR00661 family)
MDHVPGPKKNGKPRVLIAPLDWGLGHATRCIPLIRRFEQEGAEPWIGASGPQQTLLKMEFPHLSFVEIPNYNINYARSGKALPWTMLRQLSSIRRSIRKEHHWLSSSAEKYKWDAIVSDNRFGLFHPSIPSVFITHQLAIKSNRARWIDNLLRKKNYKYISRYRECWVPDNEGQSNLAGSLSHPTIKPPIPLKYIGWLSRFEQRQAKDSPGPILIILSGPEPQRSILEEKILNEIAHYPAEAIIVRGLPGHTSMIPSTNMIRIYNHISTDEMNSFVEQASFIISRSGYSTIMDAAVLNKKCIFIPTPGQTEQIYLAQSLMEKGIAFFVPQENFSLTNAISAANNFSWKPFPVNDSRLEKTVREFIASLI